MLLLALLAGAGGFAVLAFLALISPRALSMRDPAVLYVLAAGAGVATALAGGTPTQIGGVDIFLRFAVGAIVVYAGRYASRWAVLASAGLAVLASDHCPVQPLAFAAVGVLLGVVLLNRRAPLVKAIVAGAVAVVAVRLRWPAPQLTSSLAAAMVVAPTLVSGYLHLPRRDRRRVRRSAFVVAGVGGVAVLLGLLAAADARPRLQRGVDATKQGVAAARRGDRAEAASRLREAGDAFAGADRTLHSVWAAPALAVPGLSPQIRALRTVAHSGSDLGTVGADTAEDADPSTLKVANGTVPVDAIAALRQPFRRALVSMSKAETAVARIRSPWLIPPVATRVDDLLDRLSQARRDADTASAAADVVPRLLGSDGARRYFIAMQNPAEARATGGIIGNFGEMTADHGKLDLIRIGRSVDLNTKGVPPLNRSLGDNQEYNDRYAEYTPTSVWQNINMSPDFPTVSRVIGTLYPQSGGEAVDGVISVDPTALAALLRVVGPVTVPDWPEPITADNVEHVLLLDQYVRFPNRPDRVDFLATTTETIWRRLTTTQLPPPDRLIKALGPALRGKHLLLFSSRPDEERFFDMTEISGRLAPVRGDYLGVVTQDGTGTKIDSFMHRKIDYHANVDPSTGQLTATAKIVLNNDAPDTGLPDYVIGNEANYGVPRGVNRTYLSIYSPWSFTKATIDGQPLFLENQNELGRHVASDFIDVPPKGTVTIEVSFTGRLSDPEHYRLDVFHQPTVNADDVTTSVSVAGGGRVDPESRLSSLSRQTASLRFTSTADTTLLADLRRD